MHGVSIAYIPTFVEWFGQEKYDIYVVEVTEGEICVTMHVGSSYFLWACYGAISCVIDLYWN